MCVASRPPATKGSCICGSQPPHSMCLLKRAATAAPPGTPSLAPDTFSRHHPGSKPGSRIARSQQPLKRPPTLLSLPGARRALAYLPALMECSTARCPQPCYHPCPAPGSRSPPGLPLRLAERPRHTLRTAWHRLGARHTHTPLLGP